MQVGEINFDGRRSVFGGWRVLLLLFLWNISTLAIGIGLHLDFSLAALIGVLPPLGVLGLIQLWRRRKLALGPVTVAANEVRAPNFGPAMSRALADAVSGAKVAQTAGARVSRLRVLVCAFEPRFDPLVEADAECYGRVCSATTRATFASPAQFLNALAQGFDVVHLFGEVADKQIIGLGYSGETLIGECAGAGVKLLWMASENDPQIYIDDFHARGRSMNLIMTLQRHGPIFGAFLDKLLAGMSSGEALGQAWVRLCPQGARGTSEPDSPGAIFVMGVPDWPVPRGARLGDPRGERLG